MERERWMLVKGDMSRSWRPRRRRVFLLWKGEGMRFLLLEGKEGGEGSSMLEGFVVQNRQPH